MKTRSKRSAFTLLELILSMGIVAMISVSLYAAMRTAFKARTSAEAQTAGARPAAVVLDLLQADFESVAPPGATGAMSDGFVGYAMNGAMGTAADSVTFYTIGREMGPDVKTDDPLAEGIRQVELVLRTTGDTPALIRRVRRNILSPNVVEPVDEVLARNVRSFAVRYYDGTEWLSEWDSLTQNNMLPLAVNIEVILNEPSLRDPTTPYRMTRLIPITVSTLASSTTTTAQ